jgi:hypothetical protein
LKRRSVTSFEPPAEPLTYFVDRDVGIHEVPDALRSLGANVELHRDHFPDDAPDIAWIPYATERSWVIITQDRGIQRRPHERQAVLSSGARYFCLAGGSRRGVETAALIVEHFAITDALARAMKPPIIARITQAGVRFYDFVSGEWEVVRAKHLRVRN